MPSSIKWFWILILLVVSLVPLSTGAADFISVCREKGVAAEARSELAVPGLDGWFFLARELRHLSTCNFWMPQTPGDTRSRKNDTYPQDAILDFHQQLKALGIRLIVLPVPAKAAIYPDQLDPQLVPAPGLAQADCEFFAMLRKEGVDVFDLTEDLLARRDEQMFCKTDSHWSGRACVIAAQKLAEQLKPDLTWPLTTFTAEIRSVTFTGDMASARGGTESLPLRFISTADGQSVKPSRTSPVILLGDSHCLVFHAGDDMLAAGAGLADQLAMELGTAVDLIGVRGSGATPARLSLMRLARTRPDYLKSKRVVIWCFTVRELTESDGWSKVPLSKPAAPSPGNE